MSQNHLLKLSQVVTAEPEFEPRFEGPQNKTASPVYYY